jgi:fused signal recognition particle receptor
MDWGALVFGVLALGFVFLLVVAIRRMTSKKVSAEGDDGEQPEAEGADRQLSDDDEGHLEGDGEPRHDEDEDRKPISVDAAIGARDPSRGKATAGSAGEEPKPGRKAPARPPRTEHERRAEKERLARGLAKTRGGFIARLGSLFRGRPTLDAALLDQVEEILFTADIGVGTSHDLIEGIRKELGKREMDRPEAVWDHIKRRSAEMLDLQGVGPIDVTRARPFVILVVGVNGTGKTTTIGKMAARFKQEGHSVVLAAGDTFRAAATEQLEIWGQRASCPVVKGKEGADPSSVIVDALKHAQETDAEVVIADTAGRLHTKVSLMEEIQKVRRSIGKRVEGAPHETFLVLDATTGQNAIAQAKIFKEAVDITGIVLTKLDGTAKGGVVLGICHELQIPVRFIGIGEAAEDLREFDPQAFVEALYEEAESPS